MHLIDLENIVLRIVSTGQ